MDAVGGLLLIVFAPGWPRGDMVGLGTDCRSRLRSVRQHGGEGRRSDPGWTWPARRPSKYSMDSA